MSEGGLRGEREPRYTIQELERLTGFAGRTIRYYISRGLLPPAYGRGPSATYDTDHLQRILYIDSLKQRRFSLQQITEHLEEMGTADIEVAMRGQFGPPVEMWRQYRLHDDLTMMVRDANQRDPALDMAFDLIVEYAESVLADVTRKPDGD